MVKPFDCKPGWQIWHPDWVNSVDSTLGLAESQPQLNLESRSLGLLRGYLSFDVFAKAIDVCYFTLKQRIV